MKIVLAFALLAVQACMANPYAQFYEGAPDARALPGYEASSGAMQVFSTNDFERDIPALLKRGYEYVGRSSFNAGMSASRERELRAHATKVGAQLVLVSASYTHTVSGTVPLTLPTTTTTTTTTTGTVTGAGGTAVVSGVGTSTTSGTRTTYMPYSVARGDYTAAFFVKRRSRLGVYVEALADSTRARLQSNFGVRVTLVVEGSPAFNADVLSGDLLLLFGDDRVRSPEHFIELLNKYQGKRTTLGIERGGRRLEIQADIASY